MIIGIGQRFFVLQDVAFLNLSKENRVGAAIHFPDYFRLNKGYGIVQYNGSACLPGPPPQGRCLRK